MRRQSSRIRHGTVSTGRTILLTLLVAVGGTFAPANWTPAFGGSERCPLCDPEAKIEVTKLSAATLGAIAQRHAAYNARQLARIDSLLQCGYYGPPDGEKARHTAHLLARITTANAYRDLVDLACDPGHVYEIDQAALEHLYERYSDVNLFIGVQIEHIRMGMGRVCVRYHLNERTQGTGIHGGRPFRWSVRDMKIGGRYRRVLDVDFPTGLDGEVEIMLARHYTFRVEYNRFDGAPTPYEWFLVYDIEGAWVRKWGTHQPKAYMFWVSLPATKHIHYAVAASEPPSAIDLAIDPGEPPLVGLRLYIPGLRFRMPILPDINVDDLREMELPMPILDLEYLRARRQPNWLDVDERLGFTEWKKCGPVPREIRRRFPDR